MIFDDRSSCSIITLELVGFLGIKGREVVQWIEVAGRDFERHETLLYELELTNNWGNIYPISLLGIASNPGSIDVGVTYEAFPHIPAHALDRRHGEVGLLIRQDNMTPNLDHLRVMNTRFGSGFVLGGSHKDIPQAGIQYTQEAKQVCTARFTRKLVGGKTYNLVRSLPRFLEATELGTIDPRCCRC